MLLLPCTEHVPRALCAAGPPSALVAHSVPYTSHCRSTVAGLAERRKKLAAEQEAFAEAVDAAKARAAAEEAAKWEAM